MSTTLHRLLDEAFTGVEMTEQTRDLKEEIRANLLPRASELEAAGFAPDEAVRHAVGELGDVRELVGTAFRSTPSTQAYDDVVRHRVRPSPTFVVRTVLLSLVAACCLARGGLPWSDARDPGHVSRRSRCPHPCRPSRSGARRG